jgi:hypothetical protein
MESVQEREQVVDRERRRTKYARGSSSYHRIAKPSLRRKKIDI